MKAIFRPVTTTLEFAVLAAMVTPSVFAGCGVGMPGKAAPAGKQPQSHFMQAAYRPARFVLVDNSPAGANIVGFWHVIFTLHGGGLFDDSYVQWHSDGTEIMNSGVHGSGAFCMGAWTKTGGSTYVLNHVALDYSMEPSGSLTPDAIVIIHEQVTVDQGGNHFTGMFTAQAYAPYSIDFPATPDFNNPLGPPATGTIAADRVTAN